MRVGGKTSRRAARAGLLVVAVLAAVFVGGDVAGLGIGGGVARASSGRADDVAAARRPAVPVRSGVPTGAGFDALATRLRLPAEGADAGGLTAAAVEGDPSGAVDAAVAVPSPTEGAAAAAPPADVAITPPPRSAFADGGSPPPAVHPLPTRYPDVTPSGGTWALLIGVNDYPGFRYDLRSAVNDVQDVDEALRRAGVTADRRMLLRDGDATSGKIRGGLDWLTAHAGRDATLVLFYAGHVQKLGDRTEAFVGSDGGAVTDAEVAELLDRSPASRAWIGIAACYAAGFDEVVKDGRILTAAAPAGSLAYESSSFGRSYLVEYMVHRAMLRDGLTTIEAAFDRATEQLRREHPDRMPVQVDDLGGELDLRAGANAPPPDPSSPPSSSGGTTSPPPSSPPPTTSPDGCANLTVGVVRCSH